MTNTNPGATQAPSLPDLMTMAELAATMRRTRSGVDKVRARDASFPKPIKDGDNRRSRIYFVRSEIAAYLQAKLQAREAA